QEGLGVTDGYGYVAREKLLGTLESHQRFLGVSGLRLRLAERRMQQRQILVLMHERSEDLDRLVGAVAVHERERLTVAVADGVGAVGDLLRILPGEVHIAGRGEHPYALADQFVALRVLYL